MAASHGVHPTIDAFANEANHVLPTFWTESCDAFNKAWSDKVLWMNPPWSKLNEVINKLVMEQAKGILIAPIWKREPWWMMLETITIDFIDISGKVPAYQRDSGM